LPHSSTSWQNNLGRSEIEDHNLPRISMLQKSFLGVGESYDGNILEVKYLYPRYGICLCGVHATVVHHFNYLTSC
jgi:hypothetical protein